MDDETHIDRSRQRAFITTAALVNKRWEMGNGGAAAGPERDGMPRTICARRGRRGDDIGASQKRHNLPRCHRTATSRERAARMGRPRSGWPFAFSWRHKIHDDWPNRSIYTTHTRYRHTQTDKTRWSTLVNVRWLMPEAGSRGSGEASPRMLRGNANSEIVEFVWCDR